MEVSSMNCFNNAKYLILYLLYRLCSSELDQTRVGGKLTILVEIFSPTVSHPPLLALQ